MAKGRIIKTLLLIITACIFTAFLVACSDKKEPSISIDSPELNMSVGESEQLTASLSGEEGTVIWNCSDPQTVLLSVSENDKTVTIEALKVGQAVISASVGDLSAECTVTVFETLSSLSLSYGGLDALSFRVGDTLDPAYIDVESGVENLQYRFTLSSQGKEIVLDQPYAFESAGEYLLKAEVITEGYFGNAQISFQVSEQETNEIEAVLKYDNSADSIQEYIGFTLDYAKLSVESTDITENQLTYVWTVADSQGNEREIPASGYSFTKADEYKIGLYIENNTYVCNSTLSVTINPLTEVPVTLMYGDEMAKEEEEWLSGTSPEEFALQQQLPAGVEGEWSVNGESFDIEKLSTLTPGVYTLKYSVTTYGYYGEDLCSVTVYRDHSDSIQLTLDDLLWTGKTYDFRPDVSGEELSFSLRVKYGEADEWVPFGGQFESSGNVTLEVAVDDDAGVERGLRKFSGIAYNHGTAYNFRPSVRSIMLVLGVTTTVNGQSGTFGDEQDIPNIVADVPEEMHYDLFIEDDTVVSIEDSKFIAANAGSTKVYAKIGYDLYEVFEVTIRDLTGYKAITSVEDWNVLPAGNSSENYVLTADIDFKDEVVAKKFGRVNYQDTDGLSGVLDGNGHAIKNYVAPAGSSQALIGQVAKTGIVRNIRFLGVVGNTTVGDYYGCVIGFLLGTAEDLYAEIKIQSGSAATSPNNTKCVGGLVGQGRGWDWALNRCIVALDEETPDNLNYTGALVGAIQNSGNPYYIRSGYVVGTSEIPVVAVAGETEAPSEFVNGSTPIEAQGRYAKFSSLEEMKAHENEHANGRFEDGGLFDRAFWSLVWDTIEA